MVRGGRKERKWEIRREVRKLKKKLSELVSFKGVKGFINLSALLIQGWLQEFMVGEGEGAPLYL